MKYGIEFMLKRFYQQLFKPYQTYDPLTSMPKREHPGKEWDEMSQRLKKTADNIEKFGEVKDIIAEASKNNPNNLPF